MSDTNDNSETIEHEAKMEILGEKLKNNEIDSSKDVDIDLGEELVVDEEDEDYYELPDGVETIDDLINKYNELIDNEPEEAEDFEEEEEGKENEGLSEVDFNQLQDEYREFGRLKESTVSDLINKGLPQQLIDAHLNGLDAIYKVQENQVFEMVGGEDNYNELIDWAGSNLTDEQINTFNSAVDSNDFNRLLLSINGIRAIYEQKNGQLNNQSVRGYAAQSSAAFRSQEEVIEAMSDPRYENDEAYRNEIASKLKRSNVF